MVSPSIHYVGGGQIAPEGDHRQCEAMWANIKRQHADTYGPNSAYNFAACNAHGIRFEGRGWNRDSAANGQQNGVNYNRDSRALCALVGSEDTISPQLEQACADFAEEAFERGYPKPLKAHSDFVATACCGDELRDFIHRFNTGEFDDMNEAQVREIIDKHVFLERPYGKHTRFEAYLEDYMLKPTVYLVTRFQAWWKDAETYWRSNRP